jgi:hypothetical protein
MNRFAKTSFVALVGTLSFAGISLASDIHPNSGREMDKTGIDTTGTTGGGTALPYVHFAAFTNAQSNQVDRAIRHWKGGAFTVSRVDQLDKGDLRTSLEQRRNAEPKQVAKLQAAIDGNSALLAKLKSQSVEVNNVVGADKAMDGSITFYVE